MFSDIRFRLRALFQRHVVERELNDELEFHLAQETEKYVRQGVARHEAERRARLAFGGIDRFKDEARDVRGVSLIDNLRRDSRYAWRGLRTRPGFTAAVVLTLGLGIGANTAMFGIVDRLLFRPPAHLTNPGNVHRVYVRYLWNGPSTDADLPYTRYLDLSRVRSFDLAAATTTRRLAIGTGVDLREMDVAVVSATVFDFFRVRPALGRFFTVSEDTIPSGAAVAVLGYGLWQARFGGRADVLGQSLHIGSGVYTIIGVAPRDLTGFSEGFVPAAFIPITSFGPSHSKTYHLDYDWSWLEMVVRRKPGVSLEAATADLTNAFRASWAAEGALDGSARWPSATQAQAHAIVAPLLMSRGPRAGNDSRVATWVMGVAVVVLLIACANVANLMLARAVTRRREIALRLALGVTRRRLLQQLLTESAMLAVFGGVIGLGLAHWGGGALRAMFEGVEQTSAAWSDGRTILFTTLVTAGVAVLTGLAPAVSALRGDLSDALKAGRRDGIYRRSAVRTGLLLFQGALSVVLLVGAGLFVRSLANVRSMRLGFDLDSVLVVEGNARGAPFTFEEASALKERLMTLALQTPGVVNASPATSVPFYSYEGRGLPFVQGGDTARIRQARPYFLLAGSPRLFATVGTRILRGRGILPEDAATSQPVAIVNESMAETLWPGQDPLGKQFRVSGRNGPFLTVVGIAENMRAGGLTGPTGNWYYVPDVQFEALFDAAIPYLLVRTSDRALHLGETLRRRLQAAMPGASYVNVVPLRDLFTPRQRSWEFGATMFAAFGALALVLAGIGLYSVMAYAVAQRTHELGVRMALGAGAGALTRMIMKQGVAFAAAGISIGSVIALALGRWIEPLLFSQKASDPVILLGVGAVLFVVAIVATLGPALRATRVNPTIALRAE